MGSLLGNVIKDNVGGADPDSFGNVETIRELTKTFRNDLGSDVSASSFTKAVVFIRSLSDRELFRTSRAFGQFLAIANAAETHQRIRLLRKPEFLKSKSNSIEGAVKSLVANGVSKSDIYESLIGQNVELIMTAHPTEVNRRTLLRKFSEIEAALTAADSLRGNDGISSEKLAVHDTLQRVVTEIWLSDEVSREKPSAREEAERGTLVVENVLWRALPDFARKLDKVVTTQLGAEYSLPLDWRGLTFGSWMGGDRDGNPNVVAKVTHEVCLNHRAKAAGLFARDLIHVAEEVSVMICCDEMRARVGPAKEPYRKFLVPIIQKLKNTKQWAKENAARVQEGIEPLPATDDIYNDGGEQLLSELTFLHKSLNSVSIGVVANGRLTDVIRNLVSFGLTFVQLDIRQESDRHEEALDCITRYLGVGSYSQWDEPTKLTWLSAELSNKRPLVRSNITPDSIFSPEAVEVLDTVRLLILVFVFGGPSHFFLPLLLLRT
jgi:phosphoenolpyruvate carboxylase